MHPPLTASIASRGRALFAALVLCVLSLTGPACKPPPVPSDGSVVATPSGWTDTARTILDVLSWILPGARAIVNALLSTPGAAPARTQVGRVFDTVGEYTVRLHDAVAAYEARGGDRCAAQAAVAGLRVALVDLAQILADNGLAFGRPLERVLDSTAAIVDELLPGCTADAGWSSAGEDANVRLRAIEAGARQRGVSLRRDLDNIPHEQH